MADEPQIEVQQLQGHINPALLREAGTRTPEEYVKALHDAQGLVTVAAAKLGVSRQAVYLMADRHLMVREAIEDARERILDVAEGRLYKRIVNDDMTAIMFLLKTLGKKRGYVERSERQYSANININVQELSEEELLRIANGVPAGDTR